MKEDPFPPLAAAAPSGLLAISKEISCDLLLAAYRKGIFPWPQPDYPYIPWVSPPKRGVIFLNEFHLSRSLRKEIRRNRYSLKVDTNFPEVIRQAAERHAQNASGGTWITPQMIQAYTELHQAGYCHSFECYEGNKLVGGLYGVSIGMMFAAESMFYKAPNASKLCLVHLVEFLNVCKVSWLDCQMVTPITASFGAREIDRDSFSLMLDEAISCGASLFPA